MTKQRPTLILVGTLIVPMADCVSADTVLDLGKQEYAAKCAVCHGPEGKGDGPFVNQLKTGSSDLTVLTANNKGEFPSARVYAILDGRAEIQEHGPREMPIWGEVYLSEGSSDKTSKEREPYVSARLHALTAYLETLQTK
jgi:mono/diheme cytochrome c family protein